MLLILIIFIILAYVISHYYFRHLSLYIDFFVLNLKLKHVFIFAFALYFFLLALVCHAKHVCIFAFASYIFWLLAPLCHALFYSCWNLHIRNGNVHGIFQNVCIEGYDQASLVYSINMKMFVSHLVHVYFLRLCFKGFSSITYLQCLA